ncbi:hypothetical protein KUTeg_013782 [Tegillarca granosa]|uniref:Potassium channel domain-containing protein n=1 Tax=Tegillarca granosa TaxID=220873 RepID=A0ABQ9F031_TEGGR|nr:hypothetical protein KUTeg_013782 [Tegillarca granosa]
MKCLTVVILIGILALYILIGGAIFFALERDNETSSSSSTLTYYYNFLNTHTCVSDTEMQTFVRAILTAYDQGIIALNTSSSAPQWDFANSAFFAMTCVTTIGYGNQSPSTAGGRVFFIFFALVGIPLNAVVLVGIGSKISIALKKFRKYVWIKKHPKVDGILKTIAIALIGLLILILVPSGIFSAVEGWTFGESIYYCVVSLTTVGFGDFVAGSGDTDYRVGYRFFIAVWLLIGLAWVAFILGETSEYYKESAEKNEKKSKKKEGEEENGSAVDMKDVEKNAKTENEKDSERN